MLNRKFLSVLLVVFVTTQLSACADFWDGRHDRVKDRYQKICRNDVNSDSSRTENYDKLKDIASSNCK